MDADRFWALIDRSREGNERDPDRQASALEQLLAQESSEEIHAFDHIYREYLRGAFRWDLWGAGYALNGGMGDDAFEYFLDWLIGRGKAVYEQVLSDPESLADVTEAEPDATDNELLRYAAQKAHESAHGSELELGPGLPDEPTGEPFDEDTVHERFPRLDAKLQG